MTASQTTKSLVPMLAKALKMDYFKLRMNNYIKEVQQQTNALKNQSIAAPADVGRFRASSILGVFFFSLFSGALVAKSCAWFLDHHSLYVYVEDDDD